MVSVLWAVIASASGLMVFCVVPILGNLAPLGVRTSVGNFYYSLAARSFKQTALVRRSLAGYDLMPIAVDDEQKVAQVTLSSGMISDDKKFPFSNPDNRISRVFAKPLALVYEEIPAAVDAELAELGYWVGEKADRDGLRKETDDDDVMVDPYITISDGLYIVDPINVLNLVSKGVDPENLETTKQLTKQRFDKYGSKIGAAETLATIMGFAAGIGGVAVMQYLRAEIIDGSGGGTTVIPVNYIDITALIDSLVIML